MYHLAVFIDLENDECWEKVKYLVKDIILKAESLGFQVESIEPQDLLETAHLNNEELWRGLIILEIERYWNFGWKEWAIRRLRVD